MSVDRRTLEVYDARAADYAARFGSGGEDVHLLAFVAELAPGARVLDLGCGPGSASALMAAEGHRPDPVDASAAMVALAQERGLPARQASFDDIAGEGPYEAVWANFSLLHAARAALPGHLAALHDALVPGGLLHIGMKTGAGEHRDSLGRLYTYVGLQELRELLQAAGFAIHAEEEGAGAGLSGDHSTWVVMRGRRDG